MTGLSARAVVFDGPKQLKLARLELSDPGPDDVVVETEFSGVSTGTERLLWSGDMPPFPGLSYPLVPGYETVGRVVRSDSDASLVGRRVFAPGARCYKDVSGLFGGAASRIVTSANRVRALPESVAASDGASHAFAEEATLLALAATARHALANATPPDLIVGHGALGRLLARITIGLGHPPPNVWETNPERANADGYAVLEPDFDGRQDYKAIYDVSGDPNILDELISRLAPGGEIVLAGFYSQPLKFSFPPAFVREARLRVAAEWTDTDLAATIDLVESGALDLDGLITHRMSAGDVDAAYRTAFEDPSCLKMILDWRRDS